MPEITVWTSISGPGDPGPGAHAFRIEQQGQKPAQAAFGRRRTTANRTQLFAESWRNSCTLKMWTPRAWR